MKILSVSTTQKYISDIKAIFSISVNGIIPIRIISLLIHYCSDFIQIFGMPLYKKCCIFANANLMLAKVFDH